MKKYGLERIAIDSPITLAEPITAVPTYVPVGMLKLYIKDVGGGQFVLCIIDENLTEFCTDASAGFSGSPHNLLDGSQHPDTVSQGASRGSLVYGNSTPKWDELTKGSANTILGSDGTDIAWRAQSFIDHGSIGGLSDDDHTQYVLRSILTTNGDLFVRLAGAVARLGVGSEGDVLTISSGLPAWDAPTGGSGGNEWSVLTNGDSDYPELVFGDGDVIMTEIMP